MVFCIEKPRVLVTALLSLELGVCHPHCLVWGGVVICLGLKESCCVTLYTYIFCFALAFSSYSPKSLCFTCYTSLYLLNYAYHCARMSSSEMWTILLDQGSLGVAPSERCLGAAPTGRSSWGVVGEVLMGRYRGGAWGRRRWGGAWGWLCRGGGWGDFGLIADWVSNFRLYWWRRDMSMWLIHCTTMQIGLWIFPFGLSSWR
jgi:hypothetical protein